MRALLLVCLVARFASADPTFEHYVSIDSLTGDPKATRLDDLQKVLDTADPDGKPAALLAIAEHFGRKWHASKSTSDGKSAAKLFAELVTDDKYRTFAQRDVALFEYGYLLQATNDMKSARATYEVVLKDYPNSKYVPEAHLAFAEYYMGQQSYADAESFYKMALKFPRSAAYWFAMYRMGDIHVALQRFQEALETYFQVAQATKTGDADLHAAALHGFVRTYAEIGKPDKASAAFARVDNKASLEMVRELAGLYAHKDKPEAATLLYKEVLATNADPETVAAVGKLAREMRDRANRSKDAGHFELAIELYTLYVHQAPRDLDDAYLELADARASLADTRADAASWIAAADDYEAVVATSKLDRKRITKAARAGAIAYRNALDHGAGAAYVQRYTDAVDLYGKRVKASDPDLIAMREYEKRILANPPSP